MRPHRPLCSRLMLFHSLTDPAPGNSTARGVAHLHLAAHPCYTAHCCAGRSQSGQLLLLDVLELLHQLQRRRLGGEGSPPGPLPLVRRFLDLWLDALTKQQPPTHVIAAMDYPLGVTFRCGGPGIWQWLVDVVWPVAHAQE